MLIRSFLAVLTFASLVIISSCGSPQRLDYRSSWRMELNKGGCMDVCVSYQFTVANNGTYSYNGIQNVKHLGMRSGTLDPIYIDSLETILDSTYWGDYDSSYGSSGPGSQRKEVLFKTDLDTTEVIYYRMEPLQIRKLETFIDHLINRDDF
jgi:hypothetical protein